MQIDLGAVRHIFYGEADEQLSEMELALLDFETAPEDRTTLQRGFRALHTLKGSAATAGFAQLAEFAHSVENLLERLRDGQLHVGRMVMGLLLESVDALRAESAPGSLPSSTVSPVLERLTARIAAVCEGTTAAAGPLGDPIDAAAGDGAHGPDARGLATSVRMQTESLDVLLRLAERTVEAELQFQQLLAELGEPLGEKLLETFAEPLELSRRLLTELRALRRVPVGPLLQQFARFARDLSVSLGKRVRVETRGEDLRLDAAVVERLRAPLTHLIRNALAHGIEPPSARTQRQKNPWGLLTLSATRRAGGVVIECTDDGAGPDREALRSSALRRGVLSIDPNVDDPALDALMFVDGLSTAPAVSELCGRGVGLGAVRSEIEALGGTVRISGVTGAGMTVSIFLPERSREPGARG